MALKSGRMQADSLEKPEPFAFEPNLQTNDLPEGPPPVVGTFASLLNRKIIVVSDKVQYLAVERHFFSECLRLEVNKIHLDERWYLRTYPDVAMAIQNGVVADAREHYDRFGYFEHRMPYLIEVDDTWYLAQYPDVRAAISNKQFPSGQAHFLAEGFREGRFPRAHFALQPRTSET